MATIAEFAVAAEDFPLGRVFEDAPEVAIELERIVPTTAALLPYFWVWDHDMESLRRLIEPHPGVTSVSLVDEVEGGGLFRAQWDSQTEGVLTALVESNVTLLKATGNRERWTFEVRAEEMDQLSRFQRYCTDRGIDVSLTHLHSLSEMRTGTEYDLTPEQHEALVLAFDEGYYNQPRETNLEELAAKLGITRPSLSARLNRGYRNLIGSTLVHQ
ncbi:bacterio-opsin activator domain-containing protein [Halorussus sp. AFM4]|uniref:helix-turn-helix domain-containing protein n=1 Tax=Halorussus sp. AFM4 TaxID=3421651 RepID=UPI003EBDB456